MDQTNADKTTASATAAPPHNVIEGALETYTLGEVLGRGAYGVVYKGIGHDGSYVAVKRVGRAKLTVDEKKQLQEEISLLRKLNDPYIVKYVEAVDDEKSPHLDIVMEYVEGGSLFSMVRDIRKSLVDRSRVLGETHAASFIRQVVLGLRYLHRQGVVHSDIKGANILVTKDKGVKLADFGLASTKLGKDVGVVSDNPMDLLGSPYWMAPELVTQTGKSTASDIWSVGCTVIELLTGFPPNHDMNEMAALFRLMNDDCPPIPSDISPECEDFLRRCFVKDMKARATADQLLSHRWLNRAAPNDSVQDVSVSVKEHSPIVLDLPAPQGGGTAESAAAETSVVINGMQGLEMYEEDDDDDAFDDIDFDDVEDETATSSQGGAGRTGENGRKQSGYDSTGSRSDTALAVDEDPFMHIKEDPEAELERERKRRQKELWDKLKVNVGMLGKAESNHVAACDALVEMFAKHPEQRYNLIYDPGLHPILDVLESGAAGNQRVVESTLRVALSLVDGGASGPGSDESTVAARRARGGTRASSAWLDTDAAGILQTANIPQDLCLAGFLPAVARYCEPGCALEVRSLAARFVEHMLVSESTTHMFIACGGGAVCVRMLDDAVLPARTLNRVAVGGIERMLSMDNQRHKRDFCRRFVSAGLLPRLAENVASTMRAQRSARGSDKDAVRAHLVRVARLLQTFAARADPEVKASMCASAVLETLLQLIGDSAVPAAAVPALLSCVRDISRDPQTHNALQDAGAIELLVRHLDSGGAGADARAHYVVTTLHNLCVVSAARQEAAARAGVVPHLVRYIRSLDMHLRALCIDIYSGLACASPRTRVELGKHHGVDVYVELLAMLSVPGTVRKWQARVLKSISAWLDDPAQTRTVETRLVDSTNCATLCRSLAGVGVEDVEGVLEPYWKLVTGSVLVNEACGRNAELVSSMVRWLETMYAPKGGGVKTAEPRGRLLLLRTLLAHAKRWKPDSVAPGLNNAIQLLLHEVVLQTDESIIVREQANLLLAQLQAK